MNYSSFRLAVAACYKKTVFAGAAFSGLVLFLVLGLVAVTLFLAFRYLPTHSNDVMYTDISPKGMYKVLTIRPSAWGFYYHINTSSPAFTRLYDNKTGALLGESPIVDLSGNGAVTWPSNEVPAVRVGVDITFPAKPE